MKSRSRPPSDADRYVYVSADVAHCPLCDSRDLATTRTVHRDADSVSHRKRCRGCDHRFIVVTEFSE